MQSTGQFCVLQEFVSEEPPTHSLPPFDAHISFDLERVFSPPPQVFEHEDQLPNDPHLQSTGQLCVLQAFVSEDTPSHSLPPFDAKVSFDLERVFTPPPQDFEHEDQRPKTPHLQSTGHALVLHEVVSLTSPLQSFPPFEATVNFDLDRDFCPPPQDFEHELHSPNAFQTQSIGAALSKLKRKFYPSYTSKLYLIRKIQLKI